MRASFDRFQQMVADLHPTDEADPAKAEVIAALSASSNRCGVASSSSREPVGE